MWPRSSRGRGGGKALKITFIFCGYPKSDRKESVTLYRDQGPNLVTKNTESGSSCRETVISKKKHLQAENSFLKICEN